MRRVLSLLLGVVVVVSVAVAAPAAVADQHCPDPAGPPDAFDTLVEGDESSSARKLEEGREYDLVLNGGGFGHGLGMSQYGAYGAAILGCTSTEILTTYYPGIAFTDVADRAVTVGLHPSSPSGTGVDAIELRTVGEPVTYRVDGEDVLEQPADGLRLEAVHGEGGVLLRTFDDEGTRDTFGPFAETVTAELAPEQRVRTIVYRSGAPEVVELGRGRLELSSTDAVQVRVNVTLPSFDTYLYGLSEMPLSWPLEALKAQVVAGRSYAARSNRSTSGCACDILRSTSDQAYTGWAHEDPILQGGQGNVDRWQEAVDTTSGDVLGYDFGDGRGVAPVTVFYSSSHGGNSSEPGQVFGAAADVPYLQPVDTQAWDDPAVSSNRLHRWSVGFTAEELAALFGWDAWTGLEVVEREAGGRPTREPPGVRVTGLDDGQPVEVELTGEQARTRLRTARGSLPSARFYTIDDGYVPPSMAVTRADGGTRIDTAVLLSQAGWPGGTTDVVIARADDPADALAGSTLAGQLGAPVLLSPPGALPETVADELDRLGATDVWLLGGEVALSAEVAESAGAPGSPPADEPAPGEEPTASDEAPPASRTVHRVEGGDRFATAVAIATQVVETERAATPADAEPTAGRTAYLVRGRDTANPTRAWADALAVSAAAATRARDGVAWPVLTTDATLPASTRTALTDLGITEVVPVGGDVVITEQALAAVRGEGVTVADRLAGGDRWGTSRAVLADNPPADESLVIATGLAFPDGLASGPFAAHVDAGLLLVPTTLDETDSPWLEGQHAAVLRRLGWRTSTLTVAGGPVAVTDEVAQRVRRAVLSGVS